MKGNNLSNRHSAILAFRVDNLLLEEDEGRGLSKLIGRMFDLKKYKLNLKNAKIINSIWRRSDYSINLYTIAPESARAVLEKKLTGVQYSHLFLVRDYQELREHLNSQYTMFYFDGDDQALSVVGSMGRRFQTATAIIRG